MNKLLRQNIDFQSAVLNLATGDTHVIANTHLVDDITGFTPENVSVTFTGINETY